MHGRSEMSGLTYDARRLARDVKEQYLTGLANIRSSSLEGLPEMSKNSTTDGRGLARANSTTLEGLPEMSKNSTLQGL